MARPQKGKKHKRKKSWHRRGEDKTFRKVADLIPDPPVPTGEPQKLRRRPGKQDKGDAL